MKNIFLIFLILSNSVFPYNWVKVGESVDGHSFFVDIDSIERKLDYVYFYFMTDWLYPTSYGALFEISKIKSSCKHNKTLNILTYWYSGNMSKGKLLNTFSIKELPNGVGNWLYNSPESIGEQILTFACNSLE